MAMLADGKSKTKWVLNPRGSNAIEGMHFGRKMLEKMGWQSGDGLGVNKQGVTEPLRVSYKNDVKGIGYKRNPDNEWLKVEDEFSKILQNLSSGDTNQKEETCVESLEKKSKGSKARLHYHKFTRNKDLSRYTEKDLSCILGVVKSSVPPLEESNEGDKFQDKGTIDIYFEKMTQSFYQSSEKAVGNHPPNEKSSDEKPRKKRKRHEESSEAVLQIYRDKDERNSSKRTKCNRDTELIEVKSVLNVNNVDRESSKRKKSKKNKESSKDNANPEDRSGKNELKAGSELEVIGNNHDLILPSTVPSFLGNSDVKEKITKRKNSKDKKLALRDCDEYESKQSSTKVYENIDTRQAPEKKAKLAKTTKDESDDSDKRNSSKRTKCNRDTELIEVKSDLNVDSVDRESSKRKKSKKNKESSKDNASPEDRSEKNELKAGSELVVVENNHDSILPITAPSFLGNSDVKEKMTKRKNSKDKKLALSDCDEYESKQSSTKVCENLDTTQTPEKKTKLAKKTKDDSDDSDKRNSSKRTKCYGDTELIEVKSDLNVNSVDRESSKRKKSKKNKESSKDNASPEDQSKKSELKAESEPEVVANNHDLILPSMAASVLGKSDVKEKMTKRKNSKDKKLALSDCDEYESKQSSTKVCESIDTRRTPDKKAKLLALLAKTTMDESDDSDSDLNSVAHIKSVFNGSNFERIPGYRNVSTR